jgi:hypothetical protein
MKGAAMGDLDMTGTWEGRTRSRVVFVIVIIETFTTHSYNQKLIEFNVNVVMRNMVSDLL